MKATKKLLSVLLAVIMIMTSMSVCFGTVSLAAGKDVDVTALANALKFDSIKNATFSGTQNNYTVSDPDGKVLAAVEAYYAVVDAMANKSPVNQTPSSGTSDISRKGESTDKTYRTYNHLNARVKTLLQSKMGGDYTTYNVDKFITGLLAGASISEGATSTSKEYETNNNTTVLATPLDAVPEVKLTIIMESAVTAYTLDTLPNSVVTSKTFTVKHKNTNYDYAYDYTAKTNGFFGIGAKPAKFKHTFYYYYSFESVTSTNGASISTQTIKDTETTLKQYDDYFSMDMDALVEVPAATLDTVSSAVTAAKNNVVSKFSAGVFTHFFSSYNIATLVSDITLAKEIQVLKPKLIAAYEKKEEGYADIITDKQALIDLANIVKAGIDAYNAASQGAKAYVTTAGFNVSEFDSFRNAVLREIELIELRELIEEITLGVLPFAAYTVDGIADGSVTSAMIGNALATIASYEARLDKYTAVDVENEAGADFRTGLTELKQSLNYLASVAVYEDEFSAEYATYAGSIFSVTDDNGAIENLLGELQSYDSWYTGLKALIAEMKSALGEELANKLFDNLNNVMVARMDDAYVALNATVEAQIDYAYPLFVAYTSTYGEKVIMANVSEYKAMQASIGLIDSEAYSFLESTAHFELSDDAVAKYTAMQKKFPQYQEFLDSKGFSTYETNTIPDLERLDTLKDIARKNENGVYKTSDEDIEAIISLLDALLNNAQIKELLGDLINKDKVTGEPTGEAFDLAALITGLIEDNVYTDDLINTVIQFLYPAVANIFTEVWMGIDPQINDPAMAVMGQTVSVKADLYLRTVEEATAGLGLPIFPDDLAAAIRSNYSQFSAVADVLDDADSKAYIEKDANGNWDESTRVSPWNDAALFADKVDAEGNVITDDEGNTTKVLNLNWGIDELEGAAKRERFLQAVQAALCGLEPILLALLCNAPMERFNAKIGTGYGQDGLNGFMVGDILWWSDVTLSGIELDIHTIDLKLNATANDGYNNVIAPLFEMLGITAPNGQTFKSSRDVIEKGLLQPLDTVIAKLAADPVTTLLEVLPNLAYAIEADMLLPKLNYLATNISYSAGATINADLNNCTSNVGLISTLLPYLDSVVTSMTGLTCSNGVIQNVRCDDVMTDNLPVEIAGIINVGELLGGIDLTSFAGIWDMLAGSVDLLAGMEAPNAGYLATLGALGTVDTVRSAADYALPAAGKAYHINANKADVLVYLIKYVLGSGLIDGLVENPEGIVADLLASLNENPDIILSAVVELLNQKEYDTLREFEWFEGLINDESVVGNSANEIYLNPGNDWTEEKADYLYNNLDSIVGAVLTLAKLDLDKTTEEVDGSIGSVIGGAVDGLLSDKTLTALAALLAKLDLNALLAPKAEEGEETAPALDIDANSLVKDFLGIDLAAVAAQYADIAAAVEADPEYVAEFGVDAGTVTFAEALTDMLAPLSAVLDFILAGENLTVTVEDKTVELIGYDGYNNAIIPLLEALGCTVTANPENALEAVLTALIGKIEAITDSDKPIKAIIDILPGVFYFITSKGLSVSVRNLLQPVYVILDTIRPVYDLDLNALINGLLPEGIMFNIDDIGLDLVFDLLKTFVPDLDLSGLKDVIYDICYNVATEYDSASTLQENWKKGAFSENFSAADLLTVVLSFVLEWATIEDNAKALDEMLGTDGLIASVGTVFESVEINYGTPDWMYWFETEEEFNSYVEGNNALPNTLNSLTYPNDWSEEAAAYIADNLADLADMVVGLIEIDGIKYASVAELIDAKLDVFSAETINSVVGLIADLLKDVDDNLLSVGYLLDVDVVGLKNYECTAEITDVKSFAKELANILTTYAGGLVNWLFFADDFRFAKKSDNTDTIVINGGLGYEKGLALVLEALGCTLPEEATVESVLLSLASRVEEILASPVDEVIDLLPNLVYFLNANGASVAVDNLLQPVYALLDKLAVFGVELDLAGLLGFDLKYLSLADILALVKDKTGLDLSVAEEMLVDLCFGKIEKAEYTYKMVAERKDVITVVLTTALLLVKDEDFAAKLEEMLGTELISAINTVFESAPVSYKTPDWSYAVADNETLEVIDYAITYPNNWTEESAEYVADNLTSIGDMVAGIIDSNYASLGALLSDKVNIYTPETLKAIQKLLGDLIGGLDENLKDLVNVGLGAADALLGADVQGLLDYDVSGVKDKETFVAALTGMLMEVEGLVDWLLLGEDYKFFVDNDKNDIITINGGHGYANGLALVLEALGVENLPDVYAMEEIDTEKVVKAVLTATFDRVDAIFANPVEEVFDLLPNVLYFINANGLGVAVENLIGAVNALLIKLEAFGIELDIASLVNFSDILGVETELTLYNITMADAVKLVSDLTGLNLDKVADVLVGFALGEINVYDSVSSFDYTAKMEYKDEFDKHDMITVLATVAIITLTDEVNADKVKELLGEKVYEVILNLINMGEVPVQEFDWQFTERADTGYVFSAAESSGLLGENTYGMVYTEEMAQYIADNFGEFVNNIIYLLGLDADGNGETEKTLKELINSFLGGSLYNSDIVITIRDALAGVLANLTELKVNDKVVGGLIADVLKEAEIADLNAVAKVKVDEFDNDREKFVEALCDVLEPLYGILKFVLADEDFSFFVNMEKTDAITLKGAEGYAYGILPLLETLDCKNILAPADYYAAVEADGNVLLTSILNPLLDRVDEILADDPAQAILDMLPNLIYFVNSNGVDTVVKNTLNAVYAVLAAIEPIAKIDLYALIGIDLAEIDFDWLVDKLFEVLRNAGYEFTVDDIDYIAELTVGKLESYTSLNGKTAYKMVYADGESGDEKELVTVTANLVVRFLANETNKEVVLKFLREQLGMTEDVEPYVDALLDLVVDCVTETQLGAETALATIYYVFYGIDTGVDGVANGKKELKDLWLDAFDDLKKENSAAGELIEEILGWEIFEDIFSAEEGFAPNGLIKFFAKIAEWFKTIIEWFKNLFSKTETAVI